MIHQAKSRGDEINFGKRFQGKKDERGLGVKCILIWNITEHICIYVYNMYKYTTICIFISL